MWGRGYVRQVAVQVCASCLVAPLNALDGGLSILVKSIKLSEGVLHKKRQSPRFSPLPPAPTAPRKKPEYKAVLMEMTT